MGRPPRAAEDKERFRVPVRLNEADDRKLAELAAAAGVGKSSWFKLQLKKARVPAKPDPARARRPQDDEAFEAMDQDAP
jgi:ATP/maltotriose-dependent transcriptional regulator MalT